MLFSVIVPVYNSKDYLHKCLDSIIGQSFTDFELILVDDGSTDGSKEICDQYKLKDDRIRVFHQMNLGATNARKLASTVSRGDYIVPVDSDDWLPTDYLDEFHKAIDSTHADIAACGWNVVKGEAFIARSFKCRDGYYTEKEIVDSVYDWLIYSESGNKFPSGVCSKAIRRDLYIRSQEAVNDQVRIGEDKCVICFAMINARSLFIIKRPLYNYRYNINSVTKSRTRAFSWESLYCLNDFFRKHLVSTEYDFSHQIDRMIVHMLFVTARSHFAAGKYINVRKEVLDNFSRDIYQTAICECRFSHNLMESVAAFAVKHRLLMLINIYAKLSRR